MLKYKFKFHYGKENTKEVSKMFGKKGFGISDMSTIAIAFVVVAVVLGLGLTVLENIQGDQTVGGSAYNATGQGVDALDTMSGYLPTVAIVVVLALIVGIIVTYLARGNM